MLLILFVVVIILSAMVVLRLRYLGRVSEARDAHGYSSTLRRSVRGVVHFIAIIGIMLILLTPTNKYDWMCDEEEWGRPPASCTVPDDPSGNGVLMIGILLAVTITLQLILVACANNKKELIFPTAFIVLALCAWGFA
jgi:hypothetical protein